MADQPDFTENIDLSAVLSPEDLASLEAKAQVIIDHPLPTPEQLAELAGHRASSQARIMERLDEPGEEIAFDLSTPQGHVDAVTYVRTCLLALGGRANATQDPIALSELFTEAHEVWEPLPERVRFNVLLEFVLAFVALHDEVYPPTTED